MDQAPVVDGCGDERPRPLIPRGGAGRLRPCGPMRGEGVPDAKARLIVCNTSGGSQGETAVSRLRPPVTGRHQPWCPQGFRCARTGVRCRTLVVGRLQGQQPGHWHRVHGSPESPHPGRPSVTQSPSVGADARGVAVPHHAALCWRTRRECLLGDRTSARDKQTPSARAVRRAFVRFVVVQADAGRSPATRARPRARAG